MLITNLYYIKLNLGTLIISKLQISGHIRVELYDEKKTTLISAHDGTLACMSLNSDGSRLATASEKVWLYK